jgi:hypothetical protein
MLKYCGDELDPKSRTLLDSARADFVLVRPSELLSRAWMNYAAGHTEFDQFCNSKSNSAAMRALLRCEHA